MHLNPTNRLAATNEDPSGSYFPICFRDPSPEDLTQIDPGVLAGAAGKHIILRGQVHDRHGQPATAALLEFWQPNAKGV